MGRNALLIMHVYVVDKTQVCGYACPCVFLHKCVYVCVCLSVCTWIPVVYVSMWLIERPEGISDVLVYHILLCSFEMGSLSSKVWHSWIPEFNPE